MVPASALSHISLLLEETGEGKWSSSRTIRSSSPPVFSKVDRYDDLSRIICVVLWFSSLLTTFAASLTVSLTYLLSFTFVFALFSIGRKSKCALGKWQEWATKRASLRFAYCHVLNLRRLKLKRNVTSAWKQYCKKQQDVQFAYAQFRGRRQSTHYDSRPHEIRRHSESPFARPRLPSAESGSSNEAIYVSHSQPHQPGTDSIEVNKRQRQKSLETILSDHSKCEAEKNVGTTRRRTTRRVQRLSQESRGVGANEGRAVAVPHSCYEGLVGAFVLFDDEDRLVATFCGILGRCFVAWKEYTPVAKHKHLQVRTAHDLYKSNVMKRILLKWSKFSWFHSIFASWRRWAAYRKKKHPGQTKRIQHYQKAYHFNVLSRHMSIWQMHLGKRLLQKERVKLVRVDVVRELKMRSKLQLYALIHHRLQTYRLYFKKWREVHLNNMALVRLFQLDRIGMLVFHSWRLFAQASRQEKIVMEMREERKAKSANLVLEDALKQGLRCAVLH
jgi:hypothetical protein